MQQSNRNIPFKERKNLQNREKTPNDTENYRKKVEKGKNKLKTA